MSNYTPMYDNEALSTEDQDYLNNITDKTLERIIETLQRTVMHLVNTRDTARLIALQQVTNELYRRADYCMSRGADMATYDQVD